MPMVGDGQRLGYPGGQRLGTHSSTTENAPPPAAPCVVQHVIAVLAASLHPVAAERVH